MDTEEITLGQFLHDRVKEKGISLKKLSDMTGIAVNHIENMLRGDFENIPPAPYFRGYLMRLGEALNFDGEAWWLKIKREEGVGTSGPADALPKNRFIRKSPTKMIFATAGILVLLIAFGLSLPHILGKPIVTIVSPQVNPYVATVNSVIIQGVVQNANSLYLITPSASEEITISSDGSWQKDVMLEGGANTFDISAKKLLGGTTNVVEQIIYNPPAGGASTTSASSSPAAGTSTLSSSTINKK